MYIRLRALEGKSEMLIEIRKELYKKIKLGKKGLNREKGRIQ